MARGLLGQSAVYLGGFAAAGLARFVTVPLFTRELGPTAYGDAATVLAIVTATAAVAGLGGDVALSRFWFRCGTPQERRGLTVTWIGFLFLWACAVTAAVMAALMAFGSGLGSTPEFRPALMIGLASVPVAVVGRMFAQVLRNEYRPWPYSVLTAATVAAGVGFGCLFVFGPHWGVEGVFLGVLVGELMGACAGALLVHRALRSPLRPSVLGELIRFGAPIVPGALAMWVFVGADRLVVGAAMGEDALGSYSVAATLVLPIAMLMYAIGQAWAPRVTDDYERSHNNGLALAAVGLEAALLVYGTLAVVLGVTAPWVIAIVSGPEYAAGAAAMPLLALGAALQGTSMFSATGYMLARRTAAAIPVPLVAAGATLGLLFVLTPRWGFVGASAAVALGYLLLTCGLLRVSMRFVSLRVRWARVGVGFAAAATAAVACAVSPGSPVAVALSLVAIGVQGLLLLDSVRRQGRPGHSAQPPAEQSPAGRPGDSKPSNCVQRG